MTIDDGRTEDAPGGGASAAGAGWQLEGASQDAYERHLVPAIFAPCAGLLLDVAAPAPGERVLDVASGTGIVARLAARWVGADGTVAGSDVNDGMLDVARAAASGNLPPIDWRTADATALPFPDAAFDVVCCQQGLQFFGDQAGALREMHRVLTPRGRLALAVWRPQEHSPGFAVLTQVLQRHASPEAAAVLRMPFAGPDRDALRRLLADAGFVDIWISIGVVTARFASAEDYLRLQAAASPLGPHLRGLDAARMDRMLDDVRESFEPHADDDGIAFPLQTWLIRASRH